MSYHDVEARRRARARARRARVRRRRLTALGSLAAVLALVAVVLVESAGGSRTSSSSAGLRARRSGRGQPRSGSRERGASSTGAGTGEPGHAAVPILIYHVINPPIPGALFPELYVPEAEFAAQMEGLKAAGWHAVTLNQLEAHWKLGVPLGPGKPIVISFDNGYRSQYTHALPVLRRLGWVGVENIQLTGLPPSQGGLTDAQVRGLLRAGWELDTQGISHADLITLDPSELHYQVFSARQILHRRYGVPVNWFCYPSGHYDSTVIAAVRSAGYAGSTTVVPGWASRSDDPYRLPRLRVLGGTTPSELLAEIAASRTAAPPPAAYA